MRLNGNLAVNYLREAEKDGWRFKRDRLFSPLRWQPLPALITEVTNF